MRLSPANMLSPNRMSILDSVYKEEVYFGLYQALFALCKDMHIVLYCRVMNCVGK